MKSIVGLIPFVLLLVACGPTVEVPADEPDGGHTTYIDAAPCVPSGVEGTAAECSDNRDNDCDGEYDCHDPDCSGLGGCPVCGQVDTSAGGGIVLPDGVIGSACTTDADCTNPAEPNCVENECHASYTSTLNVIGFGPNQTFDDPSIIQSVCVTMEHSYLRDLEIRLIAPGGQIFRLQKFAGRNGDEVYLGGANDCDEGGPIAGSGAEYCWKPTATNPTMLEYADAGSGMDSVTSCDGFPASELPPGDYAAADAWTTFTGTPLNGEWRFVVTDLWPIDNGYLFSWTINFDPRSVSDCSGPIIE